MKHVIIWGLMVLIAGQLHADTISAGGKTLTGTFTGIESGKIHFKDSSGRIIKKHQSFISSMTLEEPYMVRFEQTGARGEQEGTLHGLLLKHYTIDQLGKKKKIPSSHMKELTVMGSASQTSGSGGGGQAEPPIDTTALRALPDLTHAQRAALDKYDRAEAPYKAYLKESSDMVARMNAATGDRRAQMLAVLRKRKGEEQPLKTAYESARASVKKAFPQGTHVTDAGRTWEKPETITLRIPKAQENTVLLIDTSFLESGRLSPSQSQAIKGYNTAKTEYETYAQTPRPADQENQLPALDKALMTAQKTMLTAFPHLKIIYE